MSRVVPWVPAAGWAAVLFLGSSRATLGVQLSGNQDKIAHFCAYLVLGLLLTRATAMLSIPAGVAVLVGWLYGVTDELHQSFVPGRSAELGDWVADALGVVVGVLLFLAFWRIRAGADVSHAPAERTTTT